MTRQFVPSRWLQGLMLAGFACAGASCKDPGATFAFDAAVVGDATATDGKDAAGGGAGTQGAGGAIVSTGGFFGGSGGFQGSTGGLPASGGASATGGTVGTGTGTGGAGGVGATGGVAGGTTTGGRGGGSATVGTGGATSSGAGGAGTGGTTAGTGGTTTAGNGGASSNGTGGAGATGGTTAGTGGATTAGTGGATTAGTGGATVQVILDPTKLLMAADFELNSGGAADAFLDCDPTKLTGNATILDTNGNSWGPDTLPSAAQKAAFANLIHAIFQSLDTPDTAGPGPGGSVGLHGWPNLNPRSTGVATNAANTGPGNRAINGGLLGFGAPPSSLVGGTMNGALAGLYKAAAIADGLVDSASATPLTPASSNAAFGAAIAAISTNPRTAIGLADNIAQCAITISIGVDDTGVVVANPTFFIHNVVEDL